MKAPMLWTSLNDHLLLILMRKMPRIVNSMPEIMSIVIKIAKNKEKKHTQEIVPKKSTKHTTLL